VLICPVCGERNPPDSVFCLACGTRLRRLGRVEEERKVVTVLVCDLVGFTARSDRADPEDVHETLQVFHALLKEVVEGFDGTVDRLVGDAVVGVFGAPIAREDDPLRGVLAAIRVRDAVDEANARDPSPGMAVRIGIATGEAVVAVCPRPDGEIVTGDVVSAAQRPRRRRPSEGSRSTTRPMRSRDASSSPRRTTRRGSTAPDRPSPAGRGASAPGRPRRSSAGRRSSSCSAPRTSEPPVARPSSW
jgi:hypothetical protein